MDAAQFARLTALRRTLEQLSEKRVLQDRLAFVQNQRATLLHIQRRLSDLSGALIARRKAHFSVLAAALDALSPLKVLGRGYALVRGEDGRILKRAQDTAVGEQVSVTLGEGGFFATVNTLREQEETADKRNSGQEEIFPT